jgi:hypothetical protein
VGALVFLGGVDGCSTWRQKLDMPIRSCKNVGKDQDCGYHSLGSVSTSLTKTNNFLFYFISKNNEFEFSILKII